LPVDSTLDREWLLQSVADHLEAPIDESVFKEMLAWPKVGSLGQRKEHYEYAAYGLIDGQPATFLDFAVDWYDDILDQYSAQSPDIEPLSIE